MRRPTTIAAAMLVPMLFASVALVAGCASSSKPSPPDALHGLVRSPRPDVSSFSLPDVFSGSDAAPFRLVAPSGGLLVVFFGYTGCAQRCAPALTALRSALDDLGGSAKRVAVAMITVDPEADTTEALTRYLTEEVGTPALHALRSTDPVELSRVTEAFAAASRLTPRPDGSYSVSFTGTVYAVDDTGKVVVEWPFGTSGADMHADLARLLRASP